MATGESQKRAAGAWRTLADGLQNDILSGRLTLGQHLVEDEIIALTSGSRHAVRRALEELERSGLAIRTPNKGVRVRSYTQQEVRDLYEMRETLEMKAALRMRLPLPAAAVAGLEAIQRRHDEAVRALDVEAIFVANNRFHEALFDACGNAALAEAIRAYAWRTHPIRMIFTAKKEWYARSMEQHREMIRLLGQDDNQALAHLCYDHLQPSKRHYLAIRPPVDAADA